MTLLKLASTRYGYYWSYPTWWLQLCRKQQHSVPFYFFFVFSSKNNIIATFWNCIQLEIEWVLEHHKELHLNPITWTNLHPSNADFGCQSGWRVVQQHQRDFGRGGGNLICLQRLLPLQEAIPGKHPPLDLCWYCQVFLLGSIRHELGQGLPAIVPTEGWFCCPLSRGSVKVQCGRIWKLLLKFPFLQVC